jgi:integrase/recombinase XerD
VTHLRRIMLEELQRRHYSQATTQHYVRFVERFAQHFHCSPDRLGPQHIREYQAQLFTVQKLSPGTVTNHLCALRFFYIQTLKKPWSIADTPYPKKRHRLPTILSQEEVAQLIDAAPTAFYRTVLMTLYATGVRNAELTRLKISDVDSQRMVLHVQGGKGRQDRDVMLSPSCSTNSARTGGGCARDPVSGCFPATAGTAAISPSILKPRATPASTPPAVPALKRKFIPTCSATASPRTCWKPMPTCTPSRSC